MADKDVVAAGAVELVVDSRGDGFATGAEASKLRLAPPVPVPAASAALLPLICCCGFW